MRNMASVSLTLLASEPLACRNGARYLESETHSVSVDDGLIFFKFGGVQSTHP